MSLRFVGSLSRALISLMTFALTACTRDSPLAPQEESDPDIRPFVILQAADALGPDGRFRIEPDIPASPENPSPISARRASELASAFVHSYGPAFLPFWEKDRGNAIRLGALKPNARVFPIHSPYGPVPTVDCHPAFARAFGSFYDVRFADGVKPELVVAVSERLTDYGISGNGDIEEPIETGMDFIHQGISVDPSGFAPLTPEQAVAVAARASGAKIQSVPRLVRRGRITDYSPVTALWRVELDREVQFRRADGILTRASVIYVNPFRDDRFLIAADSQPASVTISCFNVGENDDFVFSVLTVPVKTGELVDFISAVIVR